MLRVMTVNLFNDRSDPVDLGRVIDEHRPGLLLAQELGPRGAEVIAQRYPSHQLSPTLDYQGWGIATSSKAVFDGPAPWGRGGTASIEWEGGLQVANVHIVDPLHLPPRVTHRRRLGQLEALIDWVESASPELPVLIGGDMNASPRWQIYKELAQRWDDLAVQGAKGRPPRTWGLPGGPRLLRIDHFFGCGLHALSTMAVPVNGSDHAALLVDITVL